MNLKANRIIYKVRAATIQVVGISTRQFCVDAKGKRRMKMYPRAAVAATVQWTNPTTNLHHYLLVQRRNPPNQNKWSIPGGKIELGEETLMAAKREIEEETQIRDCLWNSKSFLTTDSIVPDKKNIGSYAFHYVIAHFFAKIPPTCGNIAPVLTPSDDALDAKWFSLEEVKDIEFSQYLSNGVIEVISQVDKLSTSGILSTEKIE